MNLRRIVATAARVLRQLKHDPRTIMLVLLVPSLLLIILRYVFNDDTHLFKALVPMMLGLFPFMMMFVVTSIATLRERTNGTFERLMTTPLTRADFIAGYAVAFSVLAVLQGAIASTVALTLLDVDVAGGAPKLLLIVLLAGILGEALGLFISVFASSEFQVVQFIPALILPQFLLSGVFTPRDHMATALQWLANILPVTYIVDAAKQVAQFGGWPHDLIVDCIVIVGYIAVVLVAGALSLRRSS